MLTLARPFGTLGIATVFVAAGIISACSSSVGNGDSGPDTVTPADTNGGDSIMSTDVSHPIDTGTLDVTAPIDGSNMDTVSIDTGPRMLACGTTTCDPDQVCCVDRTDDGGVRLSCATSCADGSVTVSCESPSDCGGNPCCAQLAATAGGAPMIGPIACTDSPMSCPPMVSLATRMGQTRLCTTDSDCTSGDPGSELPNCCTVTTADAVIHACLTTLLVGGGGGITCP